MTSELSLITPLTITAAMITSSNAVTHSATEANWNAATSYTKGTVVFRPDLGRRFENEVPGINSTPPEDAQDRWYDLGVADKMSMFDGEASTQSIADNALTVVFTPGAHDSLFLAGLDGVSMPITIKDHSGGTVTYETVADLEGSEPPDYWEHFFDPFKPRTDFLVTGLSPYAGCEVTLTVSNPGGIARCGIAAVGALVSLGKTVSGVVIAPKSYARVTADKRGATSIKKGKKARDMTVTAVLDLDEFSQVSDVLESVMSVPCVWIAASSNRLRAMRVFGLGNGKLTEQGNHATLNHFVEGMI